MGKFSKIRQQMNESVEATHARRNLTHEEFASLKKLVTIDAELPFTLLFDGE